MTIIKNGCKGCGGDYYTATEQCDTNGCNWNQYKESSQKLSEVKSEGEQ